VVVCLPFPRCPPSCSFITLKPRLERYTNLVLVPDIWFRRFWGRFRRRRRRRGGGGQAVEVCSTPLACHR